MLLKELKTKIVTKFAQSKNDTGSCGVQIALLSARIRQVSEHLKSFPKDKHSKRGLLLMVGKRKTFLNYLKRTDLTHYTSLVKSLQESDYL